MIGSILGNRYEILSEIGSGGMAKVYMAKDRYLQRIVAVKVLKDEFREDSEFLKRFDKEAQAAASLTHPNIVQIYDVGRDNNRYYIVMEFVDGITLKEYIDERESLNWRDAVNLSIQICSALSKAHSRHIIHRDIKPNNIIMTSDGVPKVADFGIARSVSTDTATTKIDTIGSVHYSSPEQARGGYTDEQSDIYSIGVTVFEMVTGTLPFDGETPVAVALKHIQEEPPVPSSLKPGIPQALDQIILKAMAKSKQDRYETVNDLINDLENIRSNPAHEIVIPNVKRENSKFDTKKLTPLGDEDLKKNNSTGEYEPDHGKQRFDSRKIIMPILYITIILVIIGGIVYFLKAVMGGLFPDPASQPKEITLGTYFDRDIEEVKQELALDDIKPVITYEASDTVGKNVVIKQHPLPDTSYKVGGITPLELWVSTGVEMVKIPPVKWEDHTDMKFKLKDELGLNVVEVPEYNEEVPINRCIRIVPDNEVKKGSEVTLYWSMGPEKKQVVVPQLIDSTYDAAVKELQRSLLKLGNTYPIGREGYQGKIVDQAPKAGETVAEDSPIDIFFEEKEIETGGSSQVPSGNFKTITVTIPQGGYNFGETVRFRATVTDHATGDEIEMFDRKNVPVTDFPVGIEIPVPAAGGITIKVYINDFLVNEQTF